VLERGLREIQADADRGFADEKAVIALLASRPTPDQVLGLRPSAWMQARVRDLLRRSKDSDLARTEEIELERYLLLEHIVRLAKAHAREELAR